MSAKVTDGLWFRALTVIGQFTRECLALAARRPWRFRSWLRSGVRRNQLSPATAANSQVRRWTRGRPSAACDSHLSARESRAAMATSNRSTGGFAMNA
jgi:hypothetical protein